ncbi:hypothetical protein DL95DRAFT_385537, partial [Leptodontidium sp. 2 PMI_412]
MGGRQQRRSTWAKGGRGGSSEGYEELAAVLGDGRPHLPCPAAQTSEWRPGQASPVAVPSPLTTQECGLSIRCSQWGLDAVRREVSITKQQSERLAVRPVSVVGGSEMEGGRLAWLWAWAGWLGWLFCSGLVWFGVIPACHTLLLVLSPASSLFLL